MTATQLADYIINDDALSIECWKRTLAGMHLLLAMDYELELPVQTVQAAMRLAKKDPYMVDYVLPLIKK